MGNIVITLWVVLTIACWVMFHKLFTVYYFSMSKGILQEIIVSGIVGAVLMAITLRFWIVTAVIAIIIGLAARKRTNSAVPLVAAVIIVILVACVGMNLNAEVEKATSLNTTSQIEYRM
ncbi:MAG: hypothetical protein LUC97_09855 [Clostridiales bacterium]|nr:hypothetical protein [Clostridiales bacterium]